VIDDQGGQLGVMQPFEAIKLAKEKGLDLVEISPTADRRFARSPITANTFIRPTKRPTSSARAAAVRS